VKSVDWMTLLASCPPFNFSCISRDKTTRVYKDALARIEVVRDPQQAVGSATSPPANNSIQCFILFNPELLKNPLQQICDILSLSDIANVNWADFISIPAPLKGRHVSAHTKQLLLRLPIPLDSENSEQLIYSLLLASNKGIVLNPKAVSTFCSTLEHPTAAEASIVLSARHITLRLPMVNDLGARRALPLKLQEYFKLLLDSPEFKYDPRVKSRIDRRGIYHEGSSASASTSAAESSDRETPTPTAELLNTPATIPLASDWLHAASAALADPSVPATPAGRNQFLADSPETPSRDTLFPPSQLLPAEIATAGTTVSFVPPTTATFNLIATHAPAESPTSLETLTLAKNPLSPHAAIYAPPASEASVTTRFPPVRKETKLSRLTKLAGSALSAPVPP
jgi:hypothetical protein